MEALKLVNIPKNTMTGGTRLPRPIGKAPARNAGAVPSPTGSPSSTLSGSPSSSTSNASSSTSVESSTMPKIAVPSSPTLSPQKKKFQSSEHGITTLSSKIPQPTRKSARKDVTLNVFHTRVTASATESPDIQVSDSSITTQPKKLSRGEKLKLAFAKEKSEREAARSAARQAAQPELISAEEILAQIKQETAERIKKLREERELLRKDGGLEVQNESVKTAAPSMARATVETVEDCRKRLDQMRLRLEQEEKDRQAQRAVREADSLARQKGATELRLVAWSPVPAKPTAQEFNSDCYLPTVPTPPRAIAAQPMMVFNQCPCAHIPATVSNLVLLEPDREGDNSDESPGPVPIIIVDSTQSPHSISSADRVKNNTEVTQAQQNADIEASMAFSSELIRPHKANSKNRSFIPRPVIKVAITPNKRYPDIETGFENLGIHVPDPRNGTPDRCATSWGAYHTYHLDNEHHEEASHRSAIIQRCLQSFEKVNEWKDKKINFDLGFEPGPLDHHRGLIHDHLCISNTEGPFPNHHRTMSFLNSRYEHDPEICWQCHRAKFENLYIIWEDERSHNDEEYFEEKEEDHKGDVDLYDDDGFLIEYDEDGFLIDGTVYEDTGLHIQEQMHEDEIYLESDRNLEEDYFTEESIYGDEESDEGGRFFGEEKYDGEEPLCENKGHHEEEGQASEAELDEPEQDGVYDDTIIEQDQIPDDEVECFKAEEAITMVEEEKSLPLVLKAPSIQVTIARSRTTHTQKAKFTYLRHKILKQLKDLSPSTIKTITKTLINTSQLIVLIDPQHTALHYPLQRFFFDLLVDLARTDLCHGYLSSNRATYFHEPIQPTPLITSPPNEIVHGSTARTFPSFSRNSHFPAAHTFLTRTAKENNMSNGRVRRLKSWILNMAPCKQVVSGARKVKNGMKGLLSFGGVTGS